MPDKKNKAVKEKSNKREKLFAELKVKLLQERQSLLKEALKSHNIKEIDSHGDIVDQSNDYLNREVLLGLGEHDRLRLKDIDDALKRMEDGVYGICLMSGEEISDARLIAMPTAKYTLECQAKIESRR